MKSIYCELHLRVPTITTAALDKLAKERNLSRNELVLSIIEAGLYRDAQQSIADQYAMLVQAVTAALETFNEQLLRFQNMEQTLSALKFTVEELKYQSLH